MKIYPNKRTKKDVWELFVLKDEVVNWDMSVMPQEKLWDMSVMPQNILSNY